MHWQWKWQIFTKIVRKIVITSVLAFTEIPILQLYINFEFWKSRQIRFHYFCIFDMLYKVAELGNLVQELSEACIGQGGLTLSLQISF